MKNLFALLAIVVLTIFCSCQKHLTDEELQARIEQEVKRQLAAERDAQARELDRRRAEFNARRKALLEKKGSTTNTQAPWDPTRPPDASFEKSADNFITGRLPNPAPAPRGHASGALRRHTPGIFTEGAPDAGRVSASHFENLTDFSGKAPPLGIAIRFAVA
jgi:hypothetical protein